MPKTSRRTQAKETPADPEVPLEAALEELEELVASLEDGEMPLEEALRVFERGVSLSRACATRLREAEQRVEVLLGSGDDASRAPFEESDEEAPL